VGILFVVVSYTIYIHFFVPKSWLDISDNDKFSGQSWERQLTISIFDYLPIYAVLPPNYKAPPVPEILDGSATFHYYNKGSNWQEGRVTTTDGTRLRLPIFDFPGMIVTDEGVAIAHINNDCTGQDYCFGLISVDLSQGEHDIRVELTNTLPRSVGNWISAVTLVTLSIVGLREMLRNKVNYA
jgi:hypothetical protein